MAKMYSALQKYSNFLTFSHVKTTTLYYFFQEFAL